MDRIRSLEIKTYDIATDHGTIDGEEAAIAETKMDFKSPIFGDIPLVAYFATYNSDNDTVVDIFSTYAWDSGTLSLLKSLKVEEKS